jgi:hypothetical protein
MSAEENNAQLRTAYLSTVFSLSINYSRHPVQITALIEVLAITKVNKVTSVPNQIVDVYCDDIVSLQTHSQIQTNTYITLASS